MSLRGWFVLHSVFLGDQNQHSVFLVLSFILQCIHIYNWELLCRCCVFFCFIFSLHVSFVHRNTTFCLSIWRKKNGIWLDDACNGIVLLDFQGDLLPSTQDIHVPTFTFTLRCFFFLLSAMEFFPQLTKMVINEISQATFKRFRYIVKYAWKTFYVHFNL